MPTLEPLTIRKTLARRLSASLATECGEMLSRCRTGKFGWFRMPAEIEDARNRLAGGDYYVITYENEGRINNCVNKFIFPENTSENLQKFDAEIMSSTDSELSVLLDDLEQSMDVDNSLFDALSPKTDEERENYRKIFEALPENERQLATIRMQYFLIYLNASFYNMLSMMVHGQKLTTLVPMAMQGDKEAFCKAVQIDRNLLTGHPYFKETYVHLLRGEDQAFFDRLLYRLSNPTTRGKIRFPALFIVFAVLQSFECLDELTAAEILDICDAAGLDRFQNRIEDENNLVRRRIDYRTMQRLSK
jgi:hypothetical protein